MDVLIKKNLWVSKNKFSPTVISDFYRVVPAKTLYKKF